MKSKSIVLTSGKNPDPNDVKWFVPQPVNVFVELKTYIVKVFAFNKYE